MLWQVSDDDNRIYLLGSFHLLTPEDYPLAASVEAAFADAEQLVFELSPDEMSDPQAGQRMLQAALRTDGTTLESQLPAASWQRLQRYASERGLLIAQWQAYQPWFVALVINIAEMRRVGLDPAHGLDRHFQQRAASANKPGRGLETSASQLQLFAQMSAQEQVEALQDTLDKLDELERETRELHSLWRAGADKALFDRLGRDLQEKYPALYTRIQTARNLAWLPQLQSLLDEESDDDALVVVGAMHLLGPDGLVAMLQARGYRVERL